MLDMIQVDISTWRVIVNGYAIGQLIWTGDQFITVLTSDHTTGDGDDLGQALNDVLERHRIKEEETQQSWTTTLFNSSPSNNNYKAKNTATSPDVTAKAPNTTETGN